MVSCFTCIFFFASKNKLYRPTQNNLLFQIAKHHVLSLSLAYHFDLPGCKIYINKTNNSWNIRRWSADVWNRRWLNAESLGYASCEGAPPVKIFPRTHSRWPTIDKAATWNRLLTHHSHLNRFSNYIMHTHLNVPLLYLSLKP